MGSTDPGSIFLQTSFASEIATSLNPYASSVHHTLSFKKLQVAQAKINLKT